MITKKQLYEKGNCDIIESCGECPFYKERDGSKFQNTTESFTIVCYKQFLDSYEKYKVIDYVIGNSNE